MIEHVRRLVDQAVVRAVDGFYHGFESFLAHLLRHSVQSVFEEARRIRALGHFFMAFLDKVLQLCKEEQRIGLVFLSPAGVGTGVADRSFGNNLYEQRVVVAIILNAYHVKEVSGCLRVRL